MSIRLTDLAKRLCRRPLVKWSRTRLELLSLEDRTVPDVGVGGVAEPLLPPFPFSHSVVTVTKIADTTEGGSSPGVFRFSRTESTFPLRVSYGVGGSATLSADYARISGSVRFPFGVSTVDVVVSPVNDNIAESDETVFVILEDGWGYTVGTPGSATVVIHDFNSPPPPSPPSPPSPSLPVVSVVNTDDAVEGISAGSFQFTRTGDLSQSLTVTYSVGGAAAPESDYAALSGTVTFAANMATANAVVIPVDDAIAEYDETVIVTLQNGSSYTVGTLGDATVIIRDNEQPVVMVENIADPTEGGPAINAFRFSRAGDTSQALLVQFTTAGSTAVLGTDFTLSSITVTIPISQRTVDLSVSATEDGIHDPGETIVVTVVSGSGYMIGSTLTAASTINSRPLLNSIATQTTVEGQFLSFQLSATDPDGDSITYSATDLPDGLALNAVTGVVSGIVSAAALATGDVFNINFTADDGKGGKDQKPATVVVVRIDPIGDRQNNETDNVPGFPVVIRNADPNEQFTYTATGLPAGVIIGQATGVITSFPLIKYSDAPAGGVNNHQVVVTATSLTTNTVVSYSFTWKVFDKNPLAVIDDRFNKVGENVNFTPAVRHPELITPGYAFTFTSLPAGLSGANNSVTGQPTTTATSGVTVSINDGGQVHTRSFFWSVTDPLGPRIEGPSVVPGNSIYQYKVHWNQDVSQVNNLVSVDPGFTGGNTNGVTLTPVGAQLVNGKTVSTFQISFPNQPNKLMMTARVNGQIVATLPLTVVQIVISDPTTPENGVVPAAFERNKVVEVGRGGIEDGPPATLGVYAVLIQAGEIVNPLVPPKPGLRWRGTYGVVAPNGGQGMSQIQLGFIQHVKIDAASSTYADGKTLTNHYDGQPLAGKTFLDAEANGVIWYGDPFTPSAGELSKPFKLSDSPKAVFPLSSDQAKMVNGAPPNIPVGKKLTGTNYANTFTLDFAARTLDPLGSSQYFSHARATWSWKANGTIGANDVWEGDATAVVISPNSWTNLTITTPTLIDTTGPVANTTADKTTFVSSGP